MKTRTILSKNLDAAFSLKKVYVQIFLKHTLFVMAAAGIWINFASPLPQMESSQAMRVTFACTNPVCVHQVIPEMISGFERKTSFAWNTKSLPTALPELNLRILADRSRRVHLREMLCNRFELLLNSKHSHKMKVHHFIFFGQSFREWYFLWAMTSDMVNSVASKKRKKIRWASAIIWNFSQCEHKSVKMLASKNSVMFCKPRKQYW